METVRDAGNVVFSERSGVELIVITACYEDETTIYKVFAPDWKEMNGNQVLSLADIQGQVEKQLNKAVITVIAEYPLRGTIYRFGNYDGADWLKIGRVDGYA